MAYEQKDGNGVLFTNSYKEGNQPDMKGNIKINGEILKLSGWKKQTKNGDEFISLAVDTYKKED